MDFATMNALELAETMKRAHLEMTDGSTPAIRAAGEETYRAAKAYVAGQPKPSWRR